MFFYSISSKAFSIFFRVSDRIEYTIVENETGEFVECAAITNVIDLLSMVKFWEVPLTVQMAIFMKRFIMVTWANTPDSEDML